VLIGATSAGPVGGEVLGAPAVAVHAEVPSTRLISRSGTAAPQRATQRRPVGQPGRQ